MVKPGLATIDSVVGFITQAVAAGQGTVDAAAALDAQLQGVKADMQAIGAGGAMFAAAVAPYISVCALKLDGGWRQRCACLVGSPGKPCTGPASPALASHPPRRPSTQRTARWAPSPHSRAN